MHQVLGWEKHRWPGDLGLQLGWYSIVLWQESASRPRRHFLKVWSLTSFGKEQSRFEIGFRPGLLTKIVGFHSGAVWEHWQKDEQRFGWPEDILSRNHRNATSPLLLMHYSRCMTAFSSCHKTITDFWRVFEFWSDPRRTHPRSRFRGSIRDDTIFSEEDILGWKYTSRAFFRKYLNRRISRHAQCYPWVSVYAPYHMSNHQRLPLRVNINQWKENRGS